MGSQDVRDILGRKRTLEILEYLSDGTVRNFSEIEAEIDTSSETLTTSLDILVDHGLVERNKLSQKNVRYQITTKGETFLEGAEQLEVILSDED